MLFTWLGTVFRIGPLKVIGKGLLKDTEEAKEELKPKQPWDYNLAICSIHSLSLTWTLRRVAARTIYTNVMCKQ